MTKYDSLSTTAVSQHKEEDEIDLREIFSTLWAGKWLILLLMIMFAVGGVAYALSKPDIYQSSVLVVPANEKANVEGIGDQLGGLASLAGINIGRGTSNQTVIAKEIVQSKAFLADFVDRHNLGASLMAATGWSMERNEWQFNREVYNPETAEWLPDENGNSQEPTDWDLVKAFKEKHLRISENKETGMVTFSVESLSPPVAQQWAQWLVEDINEHMRSQDVAEAEARIAYLENKLNETNIAGMQQVFYQLIESETRTVMLANAQQEYVFKTIDPAVVPQEKSKPKRALIVILAIMLGSILGVFLVFIRTFLKGGTKSEEET